MHAPVLLAKFLFGQTDHVNAAFHRRSNPPGPGTSTPRSMAGCEHANRASECAHLLDFRDWIPVAGRVEDLHLQVSAPRRARR
jgi:hypothetical protein